MNLDDQLKGQRTTDWKNNQSRLRWYGIEVAESAFLHTSYGYFEFFISYNPDVQPDRRFKLEVYARGEVVHQCYTDTPQDCMNAGRDYMAGRGWEGDASA